LNLFALGRSQRSSKLVHSMRRLRPIDLVSSVNL
jgi:hypothetical protein